MIQKDDTISRQAATTISVMPKEHRHYQTNNLDDAYEQGWNDLQECIENLPTVQPKNGTLVIPLNESDFKSVKRIMLDNKPWCRIFYEEGGEAIPMDWIKGKQDKLVSDYKYIIDWLILEWKKEQGETHNGNQ